MNVRALALLLRRRDRRMHALQVRMDAAGLRIHRLADANVRLSETAAGLLRLLSVAAEGGDPEQPGHGERTARICAALGRRLGIAGAEAEDLRTAALLHDIGRAGKASAEGHADVAARMIESLPFSDAVGDAIRLHHDLYDGKGNRSGLAGDSIPLLARVLAVADAMDELVHDEGHGSIDAREAATVLSGTAGRVHDPLVVRALVAVTEDHDELRRLRLTSGTLTGATP